MMKGRRVGRYESQTLKPSLPTTKPLPIMKVQSLLIVTVSLLISITAARAEKKPLKVFILAGQSNMCEQGSTKTFPAIEMDPKTAPMLKDMVDAEGNAVVCEQVYYARNAPSADPDAEIPPQRRLTVLESGKFGPEFSFGIYINKLLGEPILVIKTAWGGKSVIRDFRPPSAGPYPLADAEIELLKEKGKDVEAAKAQRAEQTGKYYRMMMDHIKMVLANPKKFHPAYDEKVGYEIAGFVWFQGYNDCFNKAYPAIGEKGTPEFTSDFTEHTRLLGIFFKDIRKDLKAPDMTFVTGVFGFRGKDAPKRIKDFRAAQAAAADLPELKGSVINVFSENYWPEELSRLKTELRAISKGEIVCEGEARELQIALIKNNKIRDQNKKARKEAAKNGAENKANREAEKKVYREGIELSKKLIAAHFTAEEAKLLRVGSSAQDYHYHGSGKFQALLGKAFAEVLAEKLK